MLQKVLFFLLSSCIFSSIIAQSGKISIHGKVINSHTQEPLADCNIFVKETSSGAAADDNGNFSLMLSPGSYSIQFSYVGFETLDKRITITENKSSMYLEIKLNPTVIDEDEVTVTGKTEQMNTEIQTMAARDIQLMPNIYNDVLRSVQVMAGVATNNELTSGYNVRGGSFDENIIYLNGFEIYRPFLVKQGVEENQSLVNPDMVSGLQFYNGEFPANFGDRMASVLEVNYESEFKNEISGTVRADLMNFGANVKTKYKNLDYSIGARYAYPDAFLDKLQTTGDYISSFSDIQLLADYKISTKTKLEFLGLYAYNKYFLAPNRWEGNFGGLVRGDIRSLVIDYDGENEFRYKTTLAGVRLTHLVNNDLHLNVSAAYYHTNETENRDTEGMIYYNYDAYDSNPENYEYLKTRYEYADNEIELTSLRFQTGFDYKMGIHTLSAGLEYRIVDFDNHIDENFYEEGSQTLLQKPESSYGDDTMSLNNLSVFAVDEIKLTDEIKLNVGMRFLRYEYTDENLFSPRISLIYTPSELTKFSLGWGYYYQPPFVNELKNPELENLRSQRAIHYALGWQQQMNERLKFSAEAYYKDLDYLIPFYFDELKMIYVNGNTREGYSYGLDLQIDGELIKGVRSIFGYGYLDSKDRDYGTTEYKRRLLGQTHTLQVFLQDKFRKHSNWQSHLRFLFGSGELFYTRVGSLDEETGERVIDVDLYSPEEYYLYFRVDMGLSAEFNVLTDKKLIVIAEVLNVFNHTNYGSYDWVQVFEEYDSPYRIPKVLTPRFFNIKAEFRF